MKRPKALAVTPYAFPPVSATRLSNGVTVHTVVVADAPLVTILLTLDAGADCEALAQAGVANLAAMSLAEGTHDRDADQLAEACELLGATLDAGADWSQAQCSLTVQPQHLGAAADLLAAIVQTPRLPADGIARLRQERLAELAQQRSEPRGVADDLFLSAAFAPGTRFRVPIGGDEVRVSHLAAADVAAFHSARYRPSNLHVVVVGDVREDQVVQLCEAHYGSWLAGDAPEDAAHQVSWRLDRGVWFERREGAPQSELRVGHASVPRSHPDFYALTLLNAILGGVFTSRINLNLRERHAFTYGAFSSFDWRRAASTFEVSTAVQAEHTAAALREICREIDLVRRELVLPDELTLARDYLTGVFPIRFETTNAIASAVASRLAFRLPRTYFDDYRARLAEITREDVLRVAQEHLDPERLQIVVVGDVVVENGLQSFGMLRVRDPE